MLVNLPVFFVNNYMLGQVNKTSREQQQSNCKEETTELQAKYEDIMIRLKQDHSSIYTKFNALTRLKKQFLGIQEKKFEKTLMSIMDKMSNELVAATAAYQQIDQEIDADPQCIFLAKQLNYFQDNCVSLRREIKAKEEQIAGERERGRVLAVQRLGLKEKLYCQTAKEMKYRSKSKCLTERRQSFADQTVGSYRPNTAKQGQRKFFSLGKRMFSAALDIDGSKSSLNTKKVQTTEAETMNGKRARSYRL